jgi:hypothetical protein
MMPSRLVYVGRSGTETVRLVETAHMMGKYAALSHCWGSDTKPLMTLKNNIDLHKMKVPALPQTFADAIMAVRQLGIEYIWIDSLCIIQDDPQDWQAECPLMSQTYANAAVTIAGPGAADSHTGFLHSRHSVGTNIVVHPYGIDRRIKGAVLLSVSPFREEEYLRDKKQYEYPRVLAERAWVLQERLLSRRILYFGTRQMYYECDAGVAFERFHITVPWNDVSLGIAEDGPESRKDALSGALCPEDLYMAWRSIVSEYSGLGLRYADDNLAALSGLAKQMQGRTDDKYCAGMWWHDLPFGLLWRVPGGLSQDRRRGEIGALMGPSWSWASQPWTIGYPAADATPARQFIPLAEVIDAEVRVAGSDSFGQVESGTLTLRATIGTILVHRIGTFNVFHDPLLYHRQFRPWDIMFDARVDSNIQTIKTLLVLIGVQEAENSHEANLLEWYALCIVPVLTTDQRSNVFKRVGYATFSNSLDLENTDPQPSRSEQLHSIPSSMDPAMQRPPVPELFANSLVQTLHII